MAEIVYPEWRNRNQRIKYPFADHATLTNGSNTIDKDLFDDARIYPVGGTDSLYLSKIVVDVETVTLYVGDDTRSELAWGTFTRGGSADVVTLSDTYSRPAGILVSSSDRLNELYASLGIGTFEFDSDETPFAPSVGIPLPQPGVRGVLLDDGTFLTGDVYLVGTDGIVLSVEDEKIRVDIVGDPYALHNECLKQNLPLPGFCGIKTINGVGPDENGDFKITISGMVTIDNILRIAQDRAGNFDFSAVGLAGNIDV